MGLFGKQNLPVWGAMLSDVGANLRGDKSGALAALQAKREEEAQRQQVEKWQSGLFGNGVPTRQALGQAILTAPRGANINQAATAFELMTPQQKAAMNLGNGVTGIYDPESNQMSYQQAPNPLADREMKKIDAEIAALEALRTQRNASAGYSDARAGRPVAPRGGQAGSAPATAAPVRIADRNAYARLPSGATYIAPDGTTRRKP